MEIFTSGDGPTSFHTEICERGARLRVRGDLDSRASAALRGELAELIDERPRRLVVDLRDSPYLDSSALAVLVAARRRVVSHGGELVLTSVDPAVRRVVHLTGLDRVLPIET